MAQNHNTKKYLFLAIVATGSIIILTSVFTLCYLFTRYKTYILKKYCQ